MQLYDKHQRHITQITKNTILINGRSAAPVKGIYC
jgi:hypothetical protein